MRKVNYRIECGISLRYRHFVPIVDRVRGHDSWQKTDVRGCSCLCTAYQTLAWCSARYGLQNLNSRSGGSDAEN